MILSKIVCVPVYALVRKKKEKCVTDNSPLLWRIYLRRASIYNFHPLLWKLYYFNILNTRGNVPIRSLYLKTKGGWYGSTLPVHIAASSTARLILLQLWQGFEQQFLHSATSSVSSHSTLSSTKSGKALTFPSVKKHFQPDFGNLLLLICLY